MSIASLADRCVLSLDRFLTKLHLPIYERKGCLLTLFFHSLFADEEEVKHLKSDPQQAITVQQFRQVLEYYLAAGYECVSPADVVKGLKKDRRHFLVTFDDGYFNNQRALPVLEELKATATFFISSSHVRKGKAFWWDVLYRAGKEAGQTLEQIYGTFGPLLKTTTDKVEAQVAEQLHMPALQPHGESDRPFTPSELREFSRHPSVVIGNHTDNHAVLDNYTDEGVRHEIMTAQESLEEMTGTRPIAIAYPNGACDSRITSIAASCGLKIGFSTERRKNYVPRMNGEDQIMTLGRLCPYGNPHLLQQCQHFRTDLRLYDRYQQIKKPLKGLLRRKKG